MSLFSIQDNGIGMDENDVLHMFERFLELILQELEKWWYRARSFHC